ncbi:MAG TPA: MBL fold metallo-hydrolase [Patescibacteria group bacterium]|nr:MBL fold metallo-hydrolase [Patescibacteria group bacterium]
MENIKWFGHASFVITDTVTGNRIYYIDPFELPKDKILEKADLVFVTHAHPDHLSEGDINAILKDDTIVVATPDSLSTLQIPDEQKFPVAPNTFYTVKGIPFETVPAYNSNPEKLTFHPKSNNWVGYIITVNNQKIYHAGDTDFIPEMKDFPSKNIDIAMLPMGGHYTMDVDEMIDAANAIGAKVTVPMHYKRLLGDKATEAETKLREGVKNSIVKILKEVA